MSRSKRDASVTPITIDYCHKIDDILDQSLWARIRDVVSSLSVLLIGLLPEKHQKWCLFHGGG